MRRNDSQSKSGARIGCTHTLIREKSKARIRGIVTKWQVGNVKEKQKAGSTSLLNIIAIIPWAPLEKRDEPMAGDIGISVVVKLGERLKT